MAPGILWDEVPRIPARSFGKSRTVTDTSIWHLRYVDLAPKAFGFDQGMVGLIEPPFSDEGNRVTNLFWRQRFNDGRATVTGG